MQQSSMLSFLIVGGLVLFPVKSKAQDVRYLNKGEVTSERLIELLTPRETSPRKRGIAPVTSKPPVAGKPQCEYYRRQRSRGIKLDTPAAATVAFPVLFAFNSAELSPEATSSLDELAEALKSDSLAVCCFQLEGHTDSIGGEAYNQTLSQRRAGSVKQYLAERHNIAMERLLTVGYGEADPIADNETEEGRQKNRRVQIVNLGYGQPAEP